MKLKSHILLLLQLFTAGTLLHADSQEKKSHHNVKTMKNDNIVCITMPKCGTHLLLKCISLFESPGLTTNYDGIDNIKPSAFAEALYKRVNQYDPPHHFKGRLHTPTVGPFPKILATTMKNTKDRLFWSHWPYTQEAAKFLDNKTIANFFVIRDPRAMLVSMAHMVKDSWHGEHANIEDIVWDFIDGRQKNFIRWGVTVHEAYPLIWELGVTDFYKLYLPWMHAKNFYTVRFENLIGNKGGGSDELQLQEIKNIATHAGVTLPLEKIITIRDQLFGGSTTFREGKTDGWKKLFSPEMKVAYKKAPGATQLLIDLGYEANDQW